MSDNQVMLYLFEEFGISDGQQLQRLDKEQRNAILSALLSRRAGVRQLQRLTGIGKNIISNISKTILNQPGTVTEVNPQSWTQHLLFICEEEH